MPILIAILGAVIAAAFWYHRAQQAKDAAGDLVGAARDVRLAARRFGFKVKSNVHPADQIEDARLAAAGVAAAVAGMDGPLTRDEIERMALETRIILKAEAEEAVDISSFGRWIAGQSGTPDEAARRLAKRVHKLAGGDVGDDLLQYVEQIAGGGEALDARQLDAMDMIRRTFGRA